MTLLQVQSATSEPMAQQLLWWIVGVFASLILFGVTIIFNKMFSTLTEIKADFKESKDKLWDAINDNSKTITATNQKVAVLETGFDKDIKMLTETLKEFSTSIKQFNVTINDLSSTVRLMQSEK